MLHGPHVRLRYRVSQRRYAGLVGWFGLRWTNKPGQGQTSALAPDTSTPWWERQGSMGHVSILEVERNVRPACYPPWVAFK